MKPALSGKAAIIKILQDVGYRHDLYRVFSDSVEMIALAIANQFDLAQFDAREARYMEVIKDYTKEELTSIANILPHLIDLFENETSDYLGQIFMDMEFGNEAKGQFFTPFSMSRMMAALQIDDRLEKLVEQNGFVTVSEPSVGSGGMVLAFADEMQRRGWNFQQHLHVTATDVDIKAVHMAFIQLSIVGVPAVVIHGNTLTLEEQSHWYTPFHFMGAWDWRLRQREAATTPTSNDAPDTRISVPEVQTHGQQMELFA